MMTFIRKIKKGDRVYYQEVENVWINGKTVQRHIRYIGKDKDSPSRFPIGTVQFGYIATRLMQSDLSANDVIDMVERMGHSISGEDLEAIGIRYIFKKNDLSMSLHYARRSGGGRGAKGAGRGSGP